MVRFTLAQAAAFVWTARLGSVQRAASQLGLAQPTVSLRLRELEAALGQALFDRTARSVRLNAAGQALLEPAAALLHAATSIQARHAAAVPAIGTLALGASEAFAMTTAPMLIQAVRARFPGVRVNLLVEPSPNLVAALRAGSLDIAFLINAQDDPGYATVLLGVQETAWVASPRWDLPPVLRPADLAALPVFSSAAPSPMYWQVANWFRAAQVPMPALSWCNSIAAIVRLVEVGAGVAHLPISSVEAAMSTDLIHSFACDPPIEEARIYAAVSATLPSVVSTFMLDFVRSALKAEESGAGRSAPHASPR